MREMKEVRSMKVYDQCFALVDSFLDDSRIALKEDHVKQLLDRLPKDPKTAFLSEFMHFHRNSCLYEFDRISSFCV